MLAKLMVLIITAFVDMIGLLIVLPIMPLYARDLGAQGLMIGVLVSSFTAAQLISAPLWGRMSDKYGRRPVLLVALGAAAIAYVIFAYATSVWILLLSRIVQGAGGGTVGVIQAYVTDATEPKNRARALGWLSAATNVGVAIGPPIGAVALQAIGRPGPGLVAAGLCVVNALFAWKYLAESRDMEEASKTPRKPGASRQAIMSVIRHPGAPASRLILVYAVAIGAFHGITAILALYLADMHGFTANTIWMFFTYIGIISVITRAGILGWAVDKYGEVKLSRLGLLLLGTGLATLPFVRGYTQLAIVIALIPLGAAFTFPCVTALLSRVISSAERGLYMGLQQTFGGILRVLVPLWAGFAYDHLGKPVPFWTSAALVIGTIFLGIGVQTEESS